MQRPRRRRSPYRSARPPALPAPQASATEIIMRSAEGTYLSAGLPGHELDDKARPVFPDEQVISAGRDQHRARAGCGRRPRPRSPRAAESLFRRSAKLRVNPGGMCCEITMPAPKSAGSAVRIAWIAGGPPVDDAIATTSIGPRSCGASSSSLPGAGPALSAPEGPWST